jgi:hypothetical protein
MITSNNKDHGFFFTFKNYSTVVDQLNSKMFDLAGQAIKEAFGCTDEEAAYVLDSSFGRHLADQVVESNSPTSFRVKISELLSRSRDAREVRERIKFKRLEDKEAEESGIPASYRESCKMVSRLLESAENILSIKERRVLNNAIHKEPVLGGNQKVRKLGEALNVLSKVLSENGFVLDMVPGDLLLGPKGNRTLSFRRALPSGSDVFDEGTEIESRVSFNWEDLNASDAPRQIGEKSYEVVVYLT